MLQRAASNAYSWWWASHIRTKQSKWLEQNLQDMEEKVQTTLKLIEEDGDSFAKRAEMYYKKRPELIHFVEESYRAYRALAERYDHISTELQNANNTIASVFPEQVQFMEEDEDETPRFPRKFHDNAKGNIPKVPKAPKDLKGMFASATKKIQSKKPTKATNAAVAKSGMSKSKGLKEIDSLQKEILALQTEKEFVKSSYESGLAKYWEIEQTITDIQEKICSLQDEFGAGTVIEDDEARTLMASAALKSCQDTLAQLQEKQEKSAEEAIVEGKRIDDAREKLKSLKDEFLHGEINEEKPVAKNKSKKAVKERTSLDKESSCSTQQKHDLEMLQVKIREHFDVGSNASLSVTELAEKIDELVNKVVGLEAAVSSQTALLQRLRTETDELQTQIGILEDDKATLISGKNDLTDKLRKMEEKLLGLQELNQSVEDQNKNLQTHFTEPHYNIDHISEKVHNVKPEEELEGTLQAEWGSVVDFKSRQETKTREGASSTNHGLNKLQKLNSKDKHRDLGKAHEQHGGQEGALKPDGSPNEPQKVKQHEALKVSGSLQIEEEFSAEVNSQAESKQHEEKLDTEELKASDSSQKEKEIYAEVLMVSESLQKEKEFSAEVDFQAELKQQEEKLNSEALMVSDSSQKEKEFSADVNSQAELKQQEEKLNSEALMVSDSSQKEEFSAEVNSQVEFKQQEEKLNSEELMVSDSSQIKVSNSSHAEKEFFAEVTLQADLEKQEEKCNTEEPKVSDSSQIEKEFSAEVNLQAELKIQDEKLNKAPSRSHEESIGQESTQDPDGSLDKKQNVKPQGEMEISDSSQKEKAINQKNEDEEIKEHDPSTSNRNQGENVSVLQTSNDTDNPLEKSHDIEMEEKLDKQTSLKAVDDVLPVKTQEQAREQDDEPDWKQLFTNGIENREKTLLTEYTTILRNYKEVKKKLNEVENKNKNGDGLFDTMVQLRELKNANAKKDEQIKLLRKKLNLLQIGLGEDDESEKSTLTESPSVEREVIYDVRVMMMMDEPEISPIEKKFRMSIDELLEENLDFWLRFSTTFSQIQKFETEINDLQSDLLKLEEKQKKLDGSTTAKYSLKSDAKPLYKHLREIDTELSVWLEKSALLKGELKSRFSSLCEIQEEITVALKESAEDEDFKFTSYQAAKFQGEILNMKQENNKVADELQAGLDHVTTLQLEVERTLAKLNDEFKLGASKNAPTTIQLQRSDSRSRVPLRSFIFGIKPKKQKHSIFSCVHPVLQRKYNGFKSGINV